MNPEVFLEAAESLHMWNGGYCCNEIKDRGAYIGRSTQPELKFFASLFLPKPLPRYHKSDGWWGGHHEENTEARILALLLAYELAQDQVCKPWK